MKDSEYAIRPNKSQLKREIRAMNELGRELVKLADGHLQKLPLSDEMRQAISDGKRFSRGALQRQLRRIAGLMKHEDIAAIQLELTRIKQPARQQTAEFHQIEQWRDRLAGGDENLLTELIDRFDNIDRQHIRQLVRNARDEAESNKPPKSSRALFRYLVAIQRAGTTMTGENDKKKSDAT